ncbi:hypothetical protein JCM14076_13210 [Methylosoma difficile]
MPEISASAIAFLAGALGIVLVGQLLDLNSLTKYLGIFLALVPGLNGLVCVYFIYVAYKGSKEAVVVDAPRKAVTPRPVTSNNRPVVAPEFSSSAPKMPKNFNQVVDVIAHIKVADLPDLPEGHVVDMEGKSAGLALAEKDSPLVLCQKGVFGVSYYMEKDDAYRYVTDADIKATDLDLKALHLMALNNLTDQVNNNLKIKAFKNSYALLAGGQLEASLVLLDDLWDNVLKEQLPDALPNTPVVVIPARHVCAFCDVRSIEGIKELHAIAERVTKAGENLISESLFIRREDGKWEAFKGYY